MMKAVALTGYMSKDLPWYTNLSLTRIRCLSWHRDGKPGIFGNPFLPHLDVTQTASAMDTFILTMVLCPDVQARARAEIDQVVGHDTISSIDDRVSLPHLDAILREVLRWCPPVPLGSFIIIRFHLCTAEPLA
jgi:hypothetical protein